MRLIFHLFINFFYKLKYNKNLVISNNTRININKINSRSKKFQLSVGENSTILCNYFFEKDNAKITIGRNTYIGMNTNLITMNSITIGDNVQIAWGVTMLDNNSHSLNYLIRRDDLKLVNQGIIRYEEIISSKIVIEDDVWIGFNVIILKGVHLGKGCVIAAGSVVVNSFPEFSLIAGNPAKLIRHL